MKLVRSYPDAERVAVDLLAGAAAYGMTVGATLPSDWSKGSPPHAQVSWDGTPLMVHPILVHATVRVTVWGSGPSEAKRLAGVCQALLLAHPGGGGVAAVLPLTGILPARDPDNRAPIAAFTVRVSLRSEPIPA